MRVHAMKLRIIPHWELGKKKKIRGKRLFFNNFFFTAKYAKAEAALRMAIQLDEKPSYYFRLALTLKCLGK